MVNQLLFIPNKVKNIIQAWNHSSISIAGKTILLNSTVFYIPNYILSVMNLLVSILDYISKLAKNFLWGRTSNRHGFHSIGLTVTTLSKLEGGLGIQNLRSINHSLMVKNIFSILNSEDKIRVDIFKFKYKDWHFWNPIKISNSSWFYKSICNSANVLKPNLNLLSCNPTKVDFWQNPCIFDLPISQKPTFLNMTLDSEDIHFFDLLNSNGFCSNTLETMFGCTLDWEGIGRIKINSEDSNLWIWSHHSSKPSISSAVYETINRDISFLDA